MCIYIEREIYRYIDMDTYIYIYIYIYVYTHTPGPWEAMTLGGGTPGELDAAALISEGPNT